MMATVYGPVSNTSQLDLRVPVNLEAKHLRNDQSKF